MRALPFIHQPDWVARKASDVQQLIGDIKHTWNIEFFHFCCYGFSQGWESFYKIYREMRAVIDQNELIIFL